MNPVTANILVTGSSGLIGSEVATHFDSRGWGVHGLANNQRAVFFGPAGDTRWNQARLAASLRSFTHHELDIRDRAGVLRLVAEIRPAAIVHTAAQPSHDRTAAGAAAGSATTPRRSRSTAPPNSRAKSSRLNTATATAGSHAKARATFSPRSPRMLHKFGGHSHLRRAKRSVGGRKKVA